MEIALIICAAALIALLILVVRFPDEIRLLLRRTASIRLSATGVAVRFFAEAISERERGGPPRSTIRAEVEEISGGRILWVDDAPTNNIREVQALRTLGVEVDLVASNGEARRLAEAFDYDLVLSDIGRPNRGEESGLQVPAVLREVGLHVPLAFYVGAAEGPRTADGEWVFDKPSELLAFIAKTLGSGKSGAGK